MSYAYTILLASLVLLSPLNRAHAQGPGGGPISLQAPLNLQHPLARGLVSMWQAIPGLEGGRLWYDLRGAWPTTLTNMTAVGASGWGGTARPGGSGEVRFDGTDDYATAGLVVGLDFPDSRFTVAGWAKATTAGYLVAKRLAVSSPGGYFVRLDAGGTLTARLVEAGNLSAGQRISTTTTLLNGSWFHFVVVFTSDTVTLANNDVAIYLNGRLDQGSRTDSGAGAYVACTTCPLVLGVISDFAAPFLTGALDDVRIYSRGVSPEEAQEVYALSRSGNPGLFHRPDVGAVARNTLSGSFFPFFQ